MIGDYAERHGIGGIYDRSARSFGPGSLTGIFSRLDGITAGPDNLKNGTSSLYQDTETGGASVTVAYQIFPTLALSNIAAYRGVKYTGNYDGDYTSFLDGSDVNATTLHYHQYSDELRLALAPGSLIDGQTGLYYFGSQSHIYGHDGAAAYDVLGPADLFTSPLLGADVHSGLKSDSFAALRPGEHPSHLQTDAYCGWAGHARPFARPFAAKSAGLPDHARPEECFTGRGRQTHRFQLEGGAQYQLDNSVMVYATYSKGYKGPTFNDSLTTVGEDPAVGPRRSTVSMSA